MPNCGLHANDNERWGNGKNHDDRISKNIGGNSSIQYFSVHLGMSWYGISLSTYVENSSLVWDKIPL